MLGLSNLCRLWWGCWVLAAGTIMSWSALLGLSGLLTFQLGSGCGLWQALTIGCQEWSSSLSPACLAMAEFFLGGLHQLRWCDLHPIRAWEVFQNFLIGEGGQGLHHTLKLQHTFCQSARLPWGQWLGFFHPMLEGFCIGQDLLRLSQPEVLTAKSHILGGARISPCLGLGCWQHGVVIIYLWCMASYLGYLNVCLHPPC